MCNNTNNFGFASLNYNQMLLNPLLEPLMSPREQIQWAIQYWSGVVDTLYELEILDVDRANMLTY